MAAPYVVDVIMGDHVTGVKPICHRSQNQATIWLYEELPNDRCRPHEDC